MKLVDIHGLLMLKLFLINLDSVNVWEAQAVNNEDTFLDAFEARVKEHFKTVILGNIRNSSKLAVFNSFKSKLAFEPYLNIINVKKTFNCTNQI